MTMRVKKRNVLKAALAFMAFVAVMRLGALLIESETSQSETRTLKKPINEEEFPEFDKKLFVQTNDKRNPDEQVVEKNLAIKDNQAEYLKNRVEVDFENREPALHNQPAREKLLLKNGLKSGNASKSSPGSKYALDVTPERINRLFDILYQKERVYSEIFDELEVASFQKLIDGQGDADKALTKFKLEREKLLKVEAGKVRATEKFLDYLHEKSDLYTFDSPRDEVVKAKVEKVIKTCA
jgi:hypothetical protein